MDFVLGHPRSGTMFVSRLLEAGEPGVSDHELLYKMHRDLVWLASEYEAARVDPKAIRRLFARYRGVTPRIDCNWKLTWLLPVLLEEFPSARIVHLSRDPLDNLRSCMELDYYGEVRFDESTHRGRGRNYWLHWMPRLGGADWQRSSAFEKNCRFWATTHERLLGARTRLGERYLHLRVEDLPSSIDRLCDFLGVRRPSDERVREVLQKRVNVKETEKELVAKLGGGACDLDEERLRELCGATAARLGYERWTPRAKHQSAMVTALGGATPLEETDRLFAQKADNLKRAWAHYDARDLVLSSLPFRLSIELTQNCNFKCTMCAQSWDPRFQKYNPDYNMRPELFAKIAGELFGPALNVDLRGFGETTLLPYWPELVESLERFPFIEWNLISNLSLRRDDVWERMIRNRFVIGASIDAATDETFELIRRGSDFRSIRHNLRVVGDALQRYGSGSLYFISVIQRSNVHEMRGIIELAHSVGCREVQFHVTHGAAAVQLNGQLALNGMSRHSAEAIDAALELGVAATFNAPVFTRGLDPERVARAGALPDRRPDPSTFHGMAAAAPLEPFAERLLDAYRVVIHRRCFKPFSYASINHRGEMGTCNHMQHPEQLVMGNLNEQSLAEVWNGPLYRHFRRQLLDAAPEDSRCQWCFSSRLTD